MRFADFQRYQPRPEHNVFVFVCEDDLLLEESRDVWAKAFGGNWLFEKYAVKEFEEIPASRLMDDALTPSLFSQSRAVIVANSEKLTKGRVETLTELHGVPRSSLKVILATANPKTGDGWGRSFPVVEIDPVKPSDAARWLIDRYKLVPDVARYLVETLGSDLRQLNTEVEKLQTYAGARSVEARDVDVLILRSEQFGPFELDDAVQARDYRKAVQVLTAMLDDGGEPLVILARIVRVWRQLFVGKAIVGKKSAKDVAMAAGAPMWKANEFAANCRKHEWKRLAAGFRELLNADRAFKTSADPEVYFDVLLWKLIG
jgi:DNA polymerase III delta subunit